MRAIKRGVMAALLCVASAGWVLAQPAEQAARDGFEPISQLPAAEQLPAAPLVIAAYAFIWVAMLVYVFMLWRRLAAVDRELTTLRRSIEGRQ